MTPSLLHTRLARQLPAALAQEYFALRWTEAGLRALKGPVEHLPTAPLCAHLDLAYWASAPPREIFDLTPKEVLSGARPHPEHEARIRAAELKWPIRLLISPHGVLVLDGLHRLAKATRTQRPGVDCVRVSAAQLKAR